MSDWAGEFLNPACPVNWQDPLNRGLVGWWMAPPNSGWSRGQTWRDLVRGGHAPNDGTLQGALWSGPKEVSAFGALSFNNTGDYVSIPSTVFNRLGAPGVVSVALWIRPTTIGSYEVLFDSGVTTGTRQLSAFLGGGSFNLFVALAGTSGKEATMSEAWVVNVWQHLVISSDGSVVSVYRNGRFVGSISGSPLIGSAWVAGEWRIHGSPSGGGSDYSGFSNDLRLYNRAVSAGEGAALYAASRSGYRSQLQWLRPQTYTAPLIPAVKFKTGKVLFNKFHQVSFCSRECDCSDHSGVATGCAFPSEVLQPSCVVLSRLDFDTTGCPFCDSGLAGDLPITLYFDGVNRFATRDSSWGGGLDVDSYRTSNSVQVYSDIKLDTATCRWILRVVCAHFVTVLGHRIPTFYDVWTGEKTTGKTPVGTFYRTSGSDTIPQLTVQ